MNRSVVLLATSVLSIVCFLCFIGYIFWDGYYLPNKPCRPITYPNGQRTTQNSVIITADVLDVVLSFYDQHLDIKNNQVSIGKWYREQLQDGRYWYGCTSTDINDETTETGCIYVSNDMRNTRIEINWLRGAGSHTPCPHQFMQTP